MLRLLRHRTSVMDKSVADLAHPKILAWRPLCLAWEAGICVGVVVLHRTSTTYFAEKNAINQHT